MYSEGVEDESWLRGVQVADADGRVTFSSIVPGCYAGSTENLAQVTLAGDNVFGDDSAALQMATISGDTDSGYIASLAVRVDTTTNATGGGGAPPGGGGPNGS